jgi:hypothetical protein
LGRSKKALKDLFAEGRIPARHGTTKSENDLGRKDGHRDSFLFSNMNSVSLGPETEKNIGKDFNFFSKIVFANCFWWI